MEKIIVAAKSENRVIGKDNNLVWHLPADLRFFRNTIIDAYLLTGRKSYESAQGSEIFADDKDFVIITRNKKYKVKHGKIAFSIEAGIEIAERDGAEKLCILGGAGIYEKAMDLADKMILTEIHATFEGDRFFPSIDTTKWREISRIKHLKDEENPFDYSFVVYDRI
jgi:dihydrofolate reductase